MEDSVYDVLVHPTIAIDEIEGWESDVTKDLQVIPGA